MESNTKSRSKSQVKPQSKIGAEVVTKGERQRAIGDIKSCGDDFLKKFLSNAETLFDRKKIIDKGDWLVAHPEEGQTFSKY